MLKNSYHVVASSISLITCSKKIVILTTVLSCFGTFAWGQGNRKPPPGFCRNVKLCVDRLNLQGTPGMDGLHCWDTNGNGFPDPGEDINGDGSFDALDCQGIGGGADLDWMVTGDDMQSTPTGNVSVGIAPNGSIKFFTSDNNDDVQIAGAFYKRSSATQVGRAVGVEGLSDNHRGSGNGVRGQASSDEPGSSSVGVNGLAFGNGVSLMGMRAEAGGDPTSLGVGIQAIAACNTDVQYGVQAVAGLSSKESAFNAGIRSIGFGNDVTANGRNYGLHVAAYPGVSTSTNIGVFTRAIRPPSNIAGTPDVNYAIYAYADEDGIDNKAGYFDGDVEITGTLLNPSDAKLKLNVKPVGDKALALIQRLEPKTYSYRQDIPEFSLPQGDQFGFVAQELEEVFPQFVRESTRPAITDDNGRVVIEEYHYKAANYIGLIPVLTQAIQEQQLQIEKLKVENEALRNIRSEVEELRELLNARTKSAFGPDD